MATINIEDLFDLQRLPSGWLLIPIIIYFPIGLALAFVRIFIGLQAFLVSCILPKTAAIRSFIMRTMCFVLGIIVQESNMKQKNHSMKVIVSNHITLLDHLAVDCVLPCTTLSVWDLPSVLSWCLGYTKNDLGVRQGREVLIKNVKKYCQESSVPVLTHPEGATTNGRAGLLKFSTWPFSLQFPVCPVVVEVSRLNFLNISTSTLGSHWWSDIFWFLFSPCTFFKIRYLPEMQQADEESEDDFTHRVQEHMAKSLNIQSTAFTCANKVEYLKRYFYKPQPTSQSHNTRRLSDESKIQIQIRQVQEVLPYVPYEVIKQDLVRTRNVSLTISNILEGVVPESDLASSSSADISSTPKNTQDSNLSSPSQFYTSLSISASTFGKTADERMLSYQDRKRQLIGTARRRYIEKHGLAL